MIEISKEDQSRSYKSFVAARTQWNPCLKNLSDFLHNDAAGQHTCRITSLEFSSESDSPSQRSLDPDNLASEICKATREGEDLCGRLLIVEDLSNHVLETLGSLLKIDPLFFASHVDTFQIDMATTRPSTVTLPSTTHSQNFLNLHYHRVVEFENLESRQVLHRDMNVPRKVKILPRAKGSNIGLVRHCCSILKTEGRDGRWLGKRRFIGGRYVVGPETYVWTGLILVDPPIGSSYLSRNRDKKEFTALTLQTRLFQHGFEDLLSNSSFSRNADAEHGPPRYSPLESFVFYWNIKQPKGFAVKNPTLFSLSYYPLKMIAAEWMTYLELMYHSIKLYEYFPGNVQLAMGQIDILIADISALQQWTRRCMATAHKIRYVIDFLKYRVTEKEDIESSALITEDYKHIGLSIDTYIRRLEGLVSIATSLIQAIDSRRSLTETASISRLTYLALSFIPLTFVSGLFSMNTSIAPGGRLFGLYFAVAVPLCILVFLIVRPPKDTASALVARIWRSRVVQRFAV